jgi:hypothetical protein
VSRKAAAARKPFVNLIPYNPTAAGDKFGCALALLLSWPKFSSCLPCHTQRLLAPSPHVLQVCDPHGRGHQRLSRPLDGARRALPRALVVGRGARRQRRVRPTCARSRGAVPAQAPGPSAADAAGRFESLVLGFRWIDCFASLVQSSFYSTFAREVFNHVVDTKLSALSIPVSTGPSACCTRVRI